MPGICNIWEKITSKVYQDMFNVRSKAEDGKLRKPRHKTLQIVVKT